MIIYAYSVIKTVYTVYMVSVFLNTETREPLSWKLNVELSWVKNFVNNKHTGC